ncbi:hypothetical protein BCL90_2691 [Pedobacter alluvionis]|uniref:Uncharacterized protein n=1 Tax=Pedobacter alluvionis TaxID=475253 RepID=A0A497Y704_9SPHI|nr:hypothetical protein BCL90_2691 [Pedobacter alluvionis]
MPEVLQKINVYFYVPIRFFFQFVLSHADIQPKSTTTYLHAGSR